MTPGQRGETTGASARGVRAGSDRWWLLPLLVCLLRGLPFLVTLGRPDDPSTAYLPVGYVPKDFLQYVALLRQVPDDGRWAFANPFTTDPQHGRFVLLLFLVLGWVSRLTGLDPFWVLELSRIPLCFGFFWLLRRFCRLVFDDGAQRTWAYWLVGLSGGLEALVYVLRPWLPAAVQPTITQDLWHLQGWSTFGAFFNPLWIAGLGLTLLALEPVLRPEGPSRLRDLIQLTLSLVALHWVHVYSELVVLAVAVTRPIAEWLFGGALVWTRVTRTFVCIAVAFVVSAPLALWQLGDTVFARTSAGMLGPQHLPVFWYPVTLGALGVFAVWGFRQLARERHPWLLSLVAWTLAVIFLHTSPILNGYHFVFHLHLPIVLVAAPVVAATVATLRRRYGRLSPRLIALLVVLFVSPLAITWESLSDVRRASVTPAAYLEVARLLAAEPAGNVLAPWDLGNVIPAYGPHRVYVGHWFLTPDYTTRAQAYATLVNTPGREVDLMTLLSEERVRYLVTPAAAEERLTTALGVRVTRVLRVPGVAVIFVLGGTAG